MLRLDEVPVFGADFHLSVIDEDFAYLVGERDGFALRGEPLVSVARLIDGSRTVEEILALQTHHTTEVHTLALLDQLVEQRLVLPRYDGFQRGESAFWQAVHGAEYVAPVAGAQRIALAVVGDDSALDSVLRAFARQSIERTSSARHTLVLADDYLDIPAALVTRQMGDKRWLLAKPTGVSPWIGPLLGGDDGPCLKCLCHWLLTNRPAETLIRRSLRNAEPPTPARAATPASLEIACNLAALAAARLLTSHSGTDVLRDQLLEVDLATFQTTSHTVVRRPQCGACGDPNLMSRSGAAPLRLTSTPKVACEDGGYRNITPRETYRKHKHLISRITGAVTHVLPIPERDTTHRSVYTSGYRVAPWQSRPEQRQLRRYCGGKGRNPEQARTSALCEALERYSAVHQGDEANIRGSVRSLGDRAIHPDSLQHFSRAQRMEGRVRGAAAEAHRWIGCEVDEELELAWTPAWSLTRDRQCFVPLSYCFSDTPPGPELEFCRYNPNGAAAGNCLEEAILHGLFELIERDAVAIWWYNRIRRPALDIEALGDPYLQALRRDYLQLGWEIWALDLTHDLGVPVCVALARDERHERFCIGFGCHGSAALAAQRAFTELNQLFDPASPRRAPWDVDALPSREFLFPDPDARPLDPSSQSIAAKKTLGEDVTAHVQALAEAGLELLVVNKTRPDIGLSVAHVIVPGLRHFWPRFAPGRLFTVPHVLGWLSRPLDETELNPVSLFL